MEPPAGPGWFRTRFAAPEATGRGRNPGSAARIQFRARTACPGPVRKPSEPRRPAPETRYPSANYRSLPPELFAEGESEFDPKDSFRSEERRVGKEGRAGGASED